MNIDVLLSDEFTDFSKEIAAIHVEKKAKQDELKRTYDAFKLELKAMDEKALRLQQEWEAWVSQQNQAVEAKKSK